GIIPKVIDAAIDPDIQLAAQMTDLTLSPVSITDPNSNELLTVSSNIQQTDRVVENYVAVDNSLPIYDPNGIDTSYGFEKPLVPESNVPDRRTVADYHLNQFL